jgi:putative FmdB family regulatory protein
MPIYKYKCLNCKNKFEIFQTMSDPKITICLECGGQVKKLITFCSGKSEENNSHQRMETIKEEVRKDLEDIKNGDMEKAVDYLGEDGANEYYGITNPLDDVLKKFL